MKKRIVNKTVNIVSGGTGYTQPTEIRVPGKAILYLSTEPELRILAGGDDASKSLNVSLSLVSISLTLVVSLITGDFKSEFMRGFLCCLSALLFIAAAICFIIYKKSDNKIKNLLIEILNRQPM